MKTKVHADKYKIQTQQGVTAEKVKRKEAAIARLKLQGFNEDEIKIAETGDLSGIAKMVLDRELRSVDNIKVYETKETVHVRKLHNDWKGPDFIYALEDIQADLESGKYTTIEQCMNNDWFQNCDIEDQGQLIDIANWYLFAKKLPKKASAAEKVKNREAARARFTALGFSDDEIKVFDTGIIEDIAKMLADHQQRIKGNAVMRDESGRIIHTPKEYGDWKCSDFINALEDIQKKIINDTYTTIEQCMNDECFQNCDNKEDQEQLIDIANWYLFTQEMHKTASATGTDEVPEVKAGLSQEAVNGLLLEAAEDPMKFGGNNKATEMFDNILKKYPTAMDTPGSGYFRYRHGLAKSMKGDFAGAIVEYTKAIELEGVDLDHYKDSLYFIERGYAKFRTHDSRGAKADLTLGATKSPTAFKMWLDATIDDNSYLNTILNGISKRLKK